MSQSKLQEYVDKYKKKYSLQDYLIDYVLVNDIHYIADSNAEKTVKKKVDYYAQVQKNHHKAFTILFNKSALCNDLKDTVAHEMLHIVMWDMLEYAELIIKTSNFGDNEKKSFLDDLYDREHEMIDKLINVVK